MYYLAKEFSKIPKIVKSVQQYFWYLSQSLLNGVSNKPFIILLVKSAQYLRITIKEFGRKTIQKLNFLHCAHSNTA